MADAEDRVQEALAAHLDHLEMGGPAPDTSYLDANERRELEELIAALELTEGVAFGRGRDEQAGADAPTAVTAEGTRVIGGLREALGPGIRIEADENRLITQVGGLAIVDRWIVGTFGGRVRVWLLEVETATAVEENADCLADLKRVFRMFPDMAAIALVGRDLTALVVEPEDCEPRIQVPSGALVSRRYRRAVQPVVEAIPSFLDELIPYWDPMPAFESDGGVHVDVSSLGNDFVLRAVERQRGIGERARKGNPKKDVLLALGMKEITSLTKLANGLFEGSLDADAVEERIERLADG